MEVKLVEFILRVKLKIKYKCGLNDYTYYNTEKKNFENHFEKTLQDSQNLLNQPNFFS